jgi:5S rRNA maturation endonuclease (ribonuclease M5)
VNTVLVEGQRDIEALRSMGYTGKIYTCTHLGFNEIDLVDHISEKNSNILILTDFDKEGREINQRLTRMLEFKGIKVELGIRGEFGKIMAKLNIYAIESIDNVIESIKTEMGISESQELL